MKKIFIKNKKKIQLLLCVMVIFGLLSGYAFAADNKDASANKGYDLSLASEQTDFSMNENPDMEFKFRKERGFFGEILAFFKGFFVDEYKSIEVKAETQNGDQGLVPVVEYDKNGKFSVKLNQTGRTVKPGKHSVTINVADQGLTGGEVVSFTKDFTWGVLAFNADQSEYKTGDTSYLQFAVLDDNGDTLCDAGLTVLIDEPGLGATTLSTANGGIIRNPDCGANNVIDKPDYYSNFKLAKEGLYNITITADTPAGKRVITDKIEAKDSLLFVVKREGPTRIYPQANYSMKIGLKSVDGYKGDMVEYVPEEFLIFNFQFSNNFQFLISNIKTEVLNGEKKIIIPNVELKAGEDYWFSYTMDAPDQSPQFYLLGPLQLIQGQNILYEEKREWQIASDALTSLRAKTIQVLAGTYSGNGATSQNSDTDQVFSTFNFQLPEDNVTIKNAYIVFESQFEAFANNGNYTGFSLYFDSCVNSCTANALTGTGRSIKTDSTVLSYNDTTDSTRQVKLISDVTNEAQLLAYKGSASGTLNMQVGYNLRRGAAGVSIANAKAKLFVTYTYDKDSPSIANTVVYPLRYVDGSKATSTADDCVLGSTCPKFNYNLEIPEVKAGTSTWFEFYNQNDSTGGNTAFVTTQAKIGTNANAADFIFKELAGKVDQGNLPVHYFVAPGVTENTAQQIQYRGASTGAITHYLLGGEVVETYLASSSAATSTRTAVFPIGVLSNGGAIGTYYGNANVYFPENGPTTGIVTVKSAWFRIKSNNTTDAGATFAVSSKSGNNASTSVTTYNINPPVQVNRPTVDIINIIPSANYSEIALANATTSKNINLAVTTAANTSGGISAELVVTYTYTTEKYGYLSTVNLYAGQSMAIPDFNNPGGRGLATSSANSVLPETAGTKTMLAAGLHASYLSSDSDAGLATPVTVDARIGTVAPTCANAYNMRTDAINAYNEFYKNVTASLNTTNNQAYFVCYTNNGGADINTGGAKMNGTLTYTYKLDNSLPTSTISALVQRTDGSGIVDLTVDFGDLNNDELRGQMMVATGTACDFTSLTPIDPALDTDNVTASSGSVTIDNDADYQIGTSSGTIISAGGNTVNFDWFSKTDLNNQSGAYCVGIMANDGIGNQSPIATATITLDNAVPVISGISIPNLTFKNGDTMRATITVASEVGNLTIAPTSVINGVAVGNIQKYNNTTFTVDYAVAVGQTPRATGTIPYEIALLDYFSNKSASSSGVFANGSIDPVAPIINSVTFNPSSGLLKIGATATATIATDGSSYSPVAITINGVNVASTFASAGGNNYTVAYTVAEGDTDVADTNDLPISIVLRDSVGHLNLAYTVADAGNRPGVDAHYPVISNVTFEPSSGLLLIGDIATATIYAEGTGYTAGIITINGVDVAGTLASAGGNNYTVTYTVAEADVDIPDSSDLPVYIVLYDPAGNVSNTYTTADAGNRPGTHTLIKGEVEHYSFYDNSALQSTATSLTPVLSYQIASTTFTPGKQYLISINFSLNTNSAAGNAMANVLHGSTEFSGSKYQWESPRANATYTGNGYSYWTVWTAVAGEDINVQVAVYNTTYVYTKGYQAFVINLSDDLRQNTDWFYNTTTNAGNLPLTWTTNGASTTIAGGGHDWMILGLGHYLVDDTSSDLLMRLYNVTDATAYNQIDYETEDAGDERSFVLMSGINISGNKKFSVDARVDVASHDWTYSAIFALDLNKFQSHYVDYDTTSWGLGNTSIWYQTASTTYTVKETGDHLIWSQENVNVSANTNVVWSRITVDGTAVPSGFPDLTRDMPHSITTDEQAHHNFYLDSLYAGDRTIAAEMRETVTITPAADIHNLVIFSMNLKSPPTGTFNSQAQKTDGSGSVDISTLIADSDWEETRAKLEWATSSDCMGFFPHQATIDTLDANTSASNGDPDIDNAYPYQIGTTSAFIITSSGENTVNFDWLSKTDLPNANGETYCIRLTANDQRVNQETPDLRTIVIDNTVPTISAVVVSNQMFKIGDTMRATVTVISEAGNLAIATGTTINGATTTNIQKVNNTTFTIDYVIENGQTDRAAGTIPYDIVLADAFGNQSASSTGTFANGSMDANAPVVTAAVTADLMYKIGDSLTATVTIADDNDTYSLGNTTINGVAATNIIKISSTTYTLDYIVAQGNTDRATGSIPFSIILKDGYGNDSNTFSGNFADGSLDANPPVIQAVYVTFGNYKIGDSVNVVIDTEENNLIESAITVNNKSVINFIDNGDTTYQVTYVIAEGDSDRAAGMIPISVVMSDTYGNNNEPYTTPAGNAASIDANRPTILKIYLPNQAYKIGDVIRATTTVVGDDDSYHLGASTINNFEASNLARVSSTTYTFDYTVVSGNTDRTSGMIPVSLVLVDTIGQYNSPASTTVETNTASIDANYPVISSITFLPSTGLLKIGDTATATIHAAGNETGITAGTTMKINGKNVISTFTELGGGDYRLVYGVAENDSDHPDIDDLPVNLKIIDAAGNETTAYVAPDAANRPGVDGHRPVISNVSFNITSGVLKVGDKATATIASDGTDYTAGTITINGIDVSSTLASAGGNDYTVVYTVAEGNLDILDANDLPISISLVDFAGNHANAYTTADASNRPGVDGHKPVISNVTFSPASGLVKIGDTATATIVSDGVSYTAGTITINGKNVAGTLAAAGGNNYTVAYTVAESDTDILDSSDLPISITLFDVAGNTSDAYTAANAGGRPGVDAHRPVISNVTFLPTSGILKIGDKATATISSDGISYTAGTITINGVDVSGTLASAGGNSYSVTYTVVQGNNDINDIADLPINITLRDPAGNPSSAYTTADAANRPGVDGHKPVIGGASFSVQSGLLRIGSAVTVTISSDGTGYTAGAITVNGVDVAGTFAFVSGLDYSVVYTVSEGDTDISDASNLPVSITLIDPSGNSSDAYTAANGANRPGVDAHRPVISNVTFSPSSGLLKIGATATATIASDGTSYTAGTMTINGVSVAGTLASAGGNNYRVVYTVADGNIDIPDANDLPVSIVINDVAGNSSLTYNTADAGNRPGVDAHNPTAPGNLSYTNHTNTSVTLHYGATTTDTNFSNYKIYYKVGTTGVTEGDSVWNSSNDGNLGNINFNSATTTTITGLIVGTQYVFNIWAYDSAGNKLKAVAELSASTNYLPENASTLSQFKTDGVTAIANGGWLNSASVMLSATSTDVDGDSLKLYYELLPIADSFSIDTSEPATSCANGTAFGSCASNIWSSSLKSNWYDSNWLYRKKIVVDGGQILSTENDFPILASTTDSSLRSIANGGHVASSTGGDIMITDSDGVTPLSYERDIYNPATGQMVIWVKTNVTANTSKELYVYYGNSGVVSDQATTTGVWGANYQGVWHLDEATGGTGAIKDSTGNGNNGTDSGSPTFGSTGQISKAVTFDPTNDRINIGDTNNSLDMPGSFTLSAWIRRTTYSGYAFIAGKQPSGTAGDNYPGNYEWRLNGGTMEFLHQTDAGTAFTTYVATSTLTNNTLQYVTVVFDAGNKVNFYINGSGSGSSNQTTAHGILNNNDLVIGSRKDGYSYFGGLIDEVRISNVARSAGWVKTEYNNQSNPGSFLSFENEETSAATTSFVQINGLPDDSAGYKWQVMSCDIVGACSSWTDAGADPNFKVDHTPPTAPGDLTEAVNSSVYETLRFGATTTEPNFSEYRIYYKEGSSGVTENDMLWASTSDSHLADINFSSATSTQVINLSTLTQYTFNIWAYDLAGNKTSATELTVTTDITHTPPTGLFNSVAEKTDGSGKVDISIEADDDDNNNTLTARIDYVAGSACNFGTPLDPTLDESDISADNLPVPVIDNDAAYQVGSSTGYIRTSPGSNTVNFDWLSKTNLPAASGVYCLRLTINDLEFNQLSPATTTIYLDNLAPVTPGALTLNSALTYNAILNLGATSSDSNWTGYKIFYKQGSYGVTENDTEFSSSSDANLADADFNGATTVNITGLESGTQYVAAIWAYDDYGNKSSSTELTFTTNHIPQNPTTLLQRKNNGSTAIANGALTDEDNVKLYASVLDGNASEVLTLYFEAATSSTSFTNSTSSACASSATWNSCTSKVWAVTSAAGNYAVTPFVGMANPTALFESTVGYKWHVIACDDSGACSSWVDFNAGIPNFKVDITAPTVPGSLERVSETSDSITLRFTGSSYDNNFYEYKIFYKKGGSGVSESDSLFSSTSDAHLASADFNGATSTTISGLDEGTQYVFNLWAYDVFGRKASATAELSDNTNSAPIGSFLGATEKRDGSGAIDVYLSANDVNAENLRAKIEYVLGADCDFTNPLDPTIDEADANATSTYGDPKVENDNEFQIGNELGWITMSGGANVVSFDWLSKTDVPNATSTYCLRLTVNDGIENQLLLATTTVYIDNQSPTNPGNLTLNRKNGSSITLNYGATSSDSNFTFYKIFYKQGAATVDEGDVSHNDVNLNNNLFNGHSTTTVSGLDFDTQYSFRIYAYDLYGNKSYSDQTTVTTNAPPTGLFNSVAEKTNGSGAIDVSAEIYDKNGDDCSAKLEYVLGSACDFSPGSDPTLDEDSENISADYGGPDIANVNVYQIGNAVLIKTASGSNTVNFDWLSRSDLPAGNDVYCLRLTVNDGFDNQLVFATATVVVDNLSPIAPGSLTVGTTTGLSVALTFGTDASDLHFKEYKIFYKKNAPGVSETDFEWNRNDDIILGNESMSGLFTNIIPVSQNTLYYFNVFAYDDYGNRASSSAEVSTTTPIIPSATWREEEDTKSPTAGGYLGETQNFRLRISVANSGDWESGSRRYQLEYGVKNGTCAAALSWTKIPATPASEHFQMIASPYFVGYSSTTQKLASAGTFTSGYILESPAEMTGSQNIGVGKFTELEYAIAATVNSVNGETYCFRVTDQGAVIDNYDIYPEITLAPPPTGFFTNAAQRADGSRIVDLGIAVKDENGDKSRAKIEYATGTACVFTDAARPQLLEAPESISADFGIVNIDNASEYQIGTGTGMIETKYGTNTVNFAWDAASDLGAVDGSYCLRLSANDGFDDQVVSATATVVIDYVNPTAPGDLSEADITANSATLAFSATSSDTNFKEYKIFYKEGVSGVTESDTLWGSSSDPNLGFADFDGATTTTITGLSVNKQYVFRLWAYDKYGNKSASNGEVIIIIRYASKSENWRFFYDEYNETPTSSIASENTAPSDIAAGAIMKLRMGLKEVEGIDGEEVKMRLQYSTFSDFSANVNFVGEQGSSSIWTYGNGADSDNDPVLQRLLTGTDNNATHNESGISSTTYTHLANASSEWEFTIRANGAVIGMTYYFRAYDNTNQAAVAHAISYAFPSLLITSGSLSYGVTGISSGQSAEGVTASIDTTPTSVDFDNLTLQPQKIGIQRFSVSTNAESGYQLFVLQRSPLVSSNGADIDPVPFTNEAPNAWPAAQTPSAFGYHAGDDTLSGVSPSRFAGDDTYARFDTQMKEIGFSPIPVANEIVNFVFRIESGTMQEAGDYETSIVYILVPTFY